MLRVNNFIVKIKGKFPFLSSCFLEFSTIIAKCPFEWSCYAVVSFNYILLQEI